MGLYFKEYDIVGRNEDKLEEVLFEEPVEFDVFVLLIEFELLALFDVLVLLEEFVLLEDVFATLFEVPRSYRLIICSIILFCCICCKN